jgi:hypothetical protein
VAAPRPPPTADRAGRLHRAGAGKRGVVISRMGLPSTMSVGHSWSIVTDKACEASGAAVRAQRALPSRAVTRRAPAPATRLVTPPTHNGVDGGGPSDPGRPTRPDKRRTR